MEICGVDIPLFWTLLVGCVGLIYYYGKKRNRLLKDAGFPGPEPDIYLGNLRQIMKSDKGFEDRERFGKVYGIWLGGIPLINVLDPDILKEILIKDFDSFTDRLVLTLNDYPLSLGLVNQTGASWRRLRNIISPTFSGSKLRRMCDGLNVCSSQLTHNLIKAAERDEAIDIKMYFGAFTMDAIASTAFGINTGSQSDFDSKFLNETRKVFDRGLLGNPILFLAITFPGLVPLLTKLGFSSLSRSSNKFFNTSLKEILEARKNEPKEVRENRVDFLELMLAAVVDENRDNGDIKAGKSNDTKNDKQMTTDEVMGQAFLFFLAGYETTATALHYVAYVLATHPDVQERVIEEIESVIGSNEPDYDNIHKLEYMDRVITETHRLYSIAPALNRYISKTTTIKGWTFPEGLHINVPIPILHKDPDVYPEPNKFKPERWENKSTTDSMTYLPFGHGPRHCIGMRLAQVEMKLALVHVLKKVTFIPAEDTPTELKDFKQLSGVLTPKIPVKLKVRVR